MKFSHTSLTNHSFSTYAKFSDKTNISYPLVRTHTCAYLCVSGVQKCYLFILGYLSTIPRFSRVGLFIAVLSDFFHTGRSCALFASIFHAFKSSVTFSLLVFWKMLRMCSMNDPLQNMVCRFE